MKTPCVFHLDVVYKGGIRMITFDPLWAYLKRQDISIYNLEYDFGLNPAEINRLKHNHNFTLRKIDTYCKLLQCDITDILIYIPEKTISIRETIIPGHLK